MMATAKNKLSTDFQSAINCVPERSLLGAFGKQHHDYDHDVFNSAGSTLATPHFGPENGVHLRLQVNYGLVTDERGCPVAVSVFAGNESDSTTLMPQVEMVRNRFGIKTLVLVGDRGMISQKRIDDDLRNLEGVDWITALKSASIRKLIDGGQLQLGLFDERNLFELTHPDFARL